MTGRFISARLSPKPMASMNFPACLLSLGSKVSMWLTPPHMKRKMTDLAFGWPMTDLGISCASDKTPPSASPMNPPPIWWMKRRRAKRPQGYNSALPNINEFIQVEEEPRERIQASRIIFDVGSGAIQFGRGRRTGDSEAIHGLDRRFQIAIGIVQNTLGHGP